MSTTESVKHDTDALLIKYAPQSRDVDVCISKMQDHIEQLERERDEASKAFDHIKKVWMVTLEHRRRLEALLDNYRKWLADRIKTLESKNEQLMRSSANETRLRKIIEDANPHFDPHNAP
jgi:chromosome segregation ATPase